MDFQFCQSEKVRVFLPLKSTVSLDKTIKDKGKVT